MEKLKPIKLSLVERWYGDKTITFETNLGLRLKMISYHDGIMGIETEPGISIYDQARLVASCFLPGSDFMKKNSIFKNFKEIQFTFNHIGFSVRQENASVEGIISKYSSMTN